jgi:hypothetical protein
MPNFLEDTLQNKGFMRGNQVTPKGEEAERKHRAKLQDMSGLRSSS